jgi:hypothetical protein
MATTKKIVRVRICVSPENVRNCFKPKAIIRSKTALVLWDNADPWRQFVLDAPITAFHQGWPDRRAGICPFIDLLLLLFSSFFEHLFQYAENHPPDRGRN